MNRSLAVIFLLLGFGAQGQTIIKYYDADWQETKAEKAMYYAEFTKVETGYKCFSFWKNSKKKREESLYADTSMSKPNGLQKVYHKNGALEDSILFTTEGKIEEAFHFYANKKLECHYVSTAGGNGSVKEAYDQFGEKIKDYVYVKSTEPKGGMKNWQSFLTKNVSKDLPSSGDKPQKAKVVVNFIVDEYGYVSKPKVIESSGIKQVDQEALRVLQLSPQWKPAIYKNKPFRQPVIHQFDFDLNSSRK